MQWIGRIFGWTGLTAKWTSQRNSPSPKPEDQPIETIEPEFLPPNPFATNQPLCVFSSPKGRNSSESLLAEASDQTVAMIKKSKKSSPKKKKSLKTPIKKKSPKKKSPKKKSPKKTSPKKKTPTKKKTVKKTTSKSTKKPIKVVGAKKSKTKSTKKKIPRSAVKAKKSTKPVALKKKAAKRARKRKFAEIQQDIPTIPVSKSMTMSPRKKRAKTSKTAKKQKVMEKIYGERIVPGTKSQNQYLVKFQGVRKSDSVWMKSDDSAMFQCVLRQYKKDLKNPSRKKYMQTVVKQIDAKQRR